MRFLTILLAAFLWLPAVCFSAPEFPPLTGRVVDEAGLLPADVKSALEQQLAAYEAQTTNQVVVVTLKSLGGYDIVDYGYQLGRHWGIGQKDKNNGVLLIVAPNEREVRIEVGYGLEGTLTDADSSLIIQRILLPQFREGDYSGGIAAGVNAILRKLGGDPTQLQQLGSESMPSQTDIPAWVIILVIIIIILVRLRGGGGGGFGGFGRGGGGFRGGGGSFGGGGSSGRW